MTIPRDHSSPLREAAASTVRPAAVCVYPEHIVTARMALDQAGASAIAVATVVNFPDGANDAGRALRETRRAIAAGADEIDLLFPWQAYVGGDRGSGPLIVSKCKEACGSRLVKVIIETGELADPLLIREVAIAALDAGADFSKTSTGEAASARRPERRKSSCKPCASRAVSAQGFRRNPDARRRPRLLDWPNVCERVGDARNVSHRVECDPRRCARSNARSDQ